MRLVFPRTTRSVTPSPPLPPSLHREQLTYQFSALAATVGVTSLAIIATYLRFEWHIEDDGSIPWAEVAATVSLVAGGVVRLSVR